MNLVIALVLVLACALAFGHWRWTRQTRTLQQKLQAGQNQHQPSRVNLRELEGLPAPVQRYLRMVLVDGQAVVTGVHMKQKGSLNMQPLASRWKAFTATQSVQTGAPGFDWEARVHVAPFLAVRVHDAFVAGAGLLRASFLGLFTLASAEGAHANRGELLRYLAETPWYPTALLPSQGVRWQAVDADSAVATLQDGTTTVSLLFRFGKDALVQSVYAAERPYMEAGTVTPRPWEGQWSHYDRKDGMLVPMQGEVAWMFLNGKHPYWRGQVADLQYTFAT